MRRRVETVCLIERSDGSVLLAEKGRTFAVGILNAYGGGLEGDETPKECAIREVRQESGIVVSDLEEVGVVTFFIPHKGEEREVHFFRVTAWSGEPVETPEMRNPQWFPQYPLERMFPGDRIWLPFYLARKKFGGTVIYGPEFEVLSHQVTPVAE